MYQFQAEVMAQQLLQQAEEQADIHIYGIHRLYKQMQLRIVFMQEHIL